jgi:hypothetical protein
MNPSADLSSQLAEASCRLAELEAVEAQRAQAAKVRGAVYRISELASGALRPAGAVRAIYGVVAKFVYASNFYIALYDEERQLMSWPY